MFLITPGNGFSCKSTNSMSGSYPAFFLPIRKVRMQKSLFRRVEKYMYCHTISPGSYISWHKGAAHPLPLPLSPHFTPPPPHISPLRVILCNISLWPHFPCFSNSLFVPVSQRGRGFWRQCSKFKLQGDFSTFLREITLSSF